MQAVNPLRLTAHNTKYAVSRRGLTAFSSRHRRDHLTLIGLLLVTLQFAGIIILGITGPGVPKDPTASVLVWGGLVIGFWAVLSMRKSRFRVIPEVAPDASLITNGPYRVVRNPMYLSVLMATLGWVIDFPTIPRAAAWLVILLALVSKLLYEERLLAERFPGYDIYKSRTKRLIPYIW